MGSEQSVVVVGAGIIGASIAYQLARRSSAVVTVVDKGIGPGAGSTGASSSISRCRYSHPEMINLALSGQRLYRDWHTFTNLDEPRASLHESGVLWMMGETASTTDAQVSRLRSCGAEAEALGPDELRKRFPSLSACAAPVDLSLETEHLCRDGQSFLFEPTGGYVDPVDANQDLIDAARNRGVDVRFGSEVVGLLGSGLVKGVRLADGDLLEADTVVNAAGPWCNHLNAMAGIEHRWSLTPTRIQTVYLPCDPSLGRLPVTADASTGIYFRPQSGDQQLLVGSIRPEDEEEEVSDPDRFKQTPDAAFTELMVAALSHRIPALSAAGIPTGIAGLYTINREDVHPIVGPTGVGGFWVANGFSGHGFKLAPAIGSIVAQSLTDVKLEDDTDVDPDFFAIDRAPIEVDVKHVLA